MRALAIFIVACLVNVICISHRAHADEKEILYPDPINLNISPISSDRSIKYDYDIVYVRAPRHGNDAKSLWAEIAHPWLLDPGADLMLLHPDGREELLVARRRWVDRRSGRVVRRPVGLLFAHSRSVESRPGTIWAKQEPTSTRFVCRREKSPGSPTKPSRRISARPKPGRAISAATGKPGETYFGYGVYNMGPCPLPGGRLMFVSNRNGFRPPKHDGVTMQLFVMDEDGKNLEQIGYLNIGMALHPTVLRMGGSFSARSNRKGLRNSILWGLWSIHPDGTQWAPVISAFDTGDRAECVSLSNAALRRLDHRRGILQPKQQRLRGLFQTAAAAAGRLRPALDPRIVEDPRNPHARFGRFDNARPKIYRLPFSPTGVGVVHPLRQQRRRAGRSVGAKRQEFSGGRQVHASVRGARRQSAHGLVAGTGESSEFRPFADARWRHLPDQIGPADR